MPSYKNAEDAMGASKMTDEEKQEKHKNRALAKKKRKEIRKKRRAHGNIFTSKKKKKARMLAADKRKAADQMLARVASGDSVTGSDESVSMKYGKKMGSSMKTPFLDLERKTPSAMAVKAGIGKLMGISMKGKKHGMSMYKKDGGSMYGEKHGSSMKKPHAHPIMKHMRKF